MQRHPALQDLSRDHFVALNHVVRAKRIQQKSEHALPLDEVWQQFQALWGELEAHFDEEEELVLPLLEGQPTDHTHRLKEEHGRLREAFAQIQATQQPDDTHLFNTAEALRLHARWEEESVFQDLQTWLTDAELADLDERGRAWRLERMGPDSVGTARAG